MTVIVGLVDDGTVWLAADSQGTDGSEIVWMTEPKVWVQDGILYGVAGSQRLSTTVQHCLRPGPVGEAVIPWLATVFVPALKTAVTEYGGTDKDGELQGSLLLGIRGRLYRIDSGYAVVALSGRYEAIGSGSPYALGALHALAVAGRVDARRRLILAIQAASAFDIYCGGEVAICFDGEADE